MTADERARWDAIYLERALLAYPPPDALLVAYAPQVEAAPRRVALDLAAGLCQNAIWLAEQGYLVNAMDISRVALERGRAEMAMRNLRSINFLQQNLQTVELPQRVYDLVCVFRYLDRALFPALQEALKPGGMIIYQTFNVNRLKTHPDFQRAYLLEIGELPDYFTGWTILHDEESDDISRFVATKPLVEALPISTHQDEEFAADA